MFEEDNRTERARPVPNESEEVRERVVEFVRADYRDWDQAASMSTIVDDELTGV